MNIHEIFLKRCISLAKNGIGTTFPNPLVGSVIVFDDKIIGEGWHKKSGEPHAEVVAINSVKDKSLLKKSTIYVSLEPCSHFGKTPPCANLIVEKGIKNIVIGIIDSNSKVCGKGVEFLKSNGCNVTVGILENECFSLNKRFFTFHNKKRPYIFLKWAETKDGFIDKLRNKNSQNSPNWISNNISQKYVHKMRSEEQAVLIGTNTALNDNPSLTARKWYGKNPIRVVLDRSLKIPSTYNLYDDRCKTIVITERENNKLSKRNVIFEKISFEKNIPIEICKILFKHEIQSVIIEGGRKLLQSFIDENLWDEAIVFVGNSKFSNGLRAPNIKGVSAETKMFLDDKVLTYQNQK